MKRIGILLLLLVACRAVLAQQHAPLFPVEAMKEDFQQMRRILEEEHCCLYEYTDKRTLDSIFDDRLRLIDRPMPHHEFFGIIAPVVAKIGCMHTALWMPGAFFDLGRDKVFPLQVKVLGDDIVVTGSYRDTLEVPVGSVILEINGRPARDILEDLRTMTSADAFNPYFVDAQVGKRFAMFYASLYGFPQEYTVTYTSLGPERRATARVRPADIGLVRSVVFANFRHPPLALEFLDSSSTAIMTVKTFVYYDRVEYFRNFMDSCFALIRERRTENLILDLRGNDGGDPFCAVILYSYLEQNPAPYFAEPYGRYAGLAEPVQVAGNRFTGQLYVLVDGHCGSTNGHFSALLKYHRLGTFVGTPSGATYKCNAGKNTERRLNNTSLILTLGRSTYAAAVKGMDKTRPLMPDVPVKETSADVREMRDVTMLAALEEISKARRSGTCRQCE